MHAGTFPCYRYTQRSVARNFYYNTMNDILQVQSSLNTPNTSTRKSSYCHTTILLLPYNHSCMQLSGAVLYFFMALHGHSITDISKFVQDSTKFCSPHTILLRHIACATLIFPASCIEIA